MYMNESSNVCKSNQSTILAMYTLRLVSWKPGLINVYAYGEIAIKWCVNAHTLHVPTVKSLSQPIGMIDVVPSFRCTLTPYLWCLQLVAVPSLALALSRHMTNEALIVQPHHKTSELAWAPS